MYKIPNFSNFGEINPHPFTDKGEILDVACAGQKD